MTQKKLSTFIFSVLVFAFPFFVPFNVHAGTSSGSIGYTVVVSPPSNVPPVANAGFDQVITLPSAPQPLIGTGTDSDGSIIQLTWYFVGPLTANPTIVPSTSSTSPLSATVGGLTDPGVYTFSLVVVDDQGATGQDTVQITVNAAVPTPSGTLSATSCTINSGASSCGNTVSWATSNLTANPTSITRNTGSPSFFTPSPLAAGSQGTTLGQGTTTFYLYHNSVLLAQTSATASCIAGTTWNSTSGTCQNNTPTTPSVTLNANPSTVYSGTASTLSWTSANVSSCTASAVPASGSWVGARSTASSYPHESTGALTATTTFTLSCSGVNGPASDFKTVTVVPVNGSNIIAQLDAVPDHISLGDLSTLTWSSSNATSCSGVGFATGGATAGSTTVSPTVNTTYTLTCTNGTNSASDQALITLKRKFWFIEF